MENTGTASAQRTAHVTNNPFEQRDEAEIARLRKPYVHVHAHNIICDTDVPGAPTPKNRDPFEFVVDASKGVIPLWDRGTTLQWRFQERSLDVFADSEAARVAITELFGNALVRWGDAAPVRFTHSDDLWDFEIVMREKDRCTINGCVLASAFFPDAGRHELVLYPELFNQTPQEQIDTLIHEIGHIFGLRHFFAKIEEGNWPAEIFGEHRPFTIMNYGKNSVLTDLDKADLKRLYQAAWSGAMTHINGTKIRLMKPFHAS